MDSIEPVLTTEDHRIWRLWRRTCLVHAKGRAHKRRVDQAKATIAKMYEDHPEAYVAWSAGKDSTVLMHLCAQVHGPGTRAMSVKDDLDYPGEEAYIVDLAEQWGVSLDILHPPFSLQGWLAEHADSLDPGGDMHGRSSAFSDAAFYSVIDAYRRRVGMPGVFLGLRACESRGRALNRYVRGAIYTKADGETVAQPLGLWRDEDIYAYAFAHEIPLHPVYRCVRLHDVPGRVRKSWWLPGAHTRKGGGVWLATYWPSLWGRLCDLMPSARGMS